ncbi:MAG TPA: hypothetical protein VM638_08270 [Actinomycetota bacterium]|nr:hypothetical protein [Actinomycetota bacterium]
MRKLITAAAAAGMLATVLPASAHNINPPSSRVDEVYADVSEALIEVSGRAFFGGQRLLTVGTDPAEDFAPGPLDLTAAQIGQLDANTGELSFVLKVRDLPPNVAQVSGIPEAGRYMWDFSIDMGGADPVLFAIDGRLTNVARGQSTRIPAFELQSNCTRDGNLITCEKVADLTTEMIGSTDEIFVDIPLSVLQQHAGGSVAGRTIGEASICQGISAHLSPGLAFCGGTGGPLTSDTLTLSETSGTYTIASKRVRATIAPAGGGPSQTVEATVSPDGSFLANISRTGLAPGTYTVTAQACYGTNCATKSTTATIS